MDQQDASEKEATAVATATAATSESSTTSSQAAPKTPEPSVTSAVAATAISKVEAAQTAASDASVHAGLGADVGSAASNALIEIAVSPGKRITLLAASLVLAACLGATAGALGTHHLTPSAKTPPVAPGSINLPEIQALKENVVQARVELAALKASVDGGNRNASTQFTRMGERIDRLERLQTEPAAKLTKAIDTLDRLARDPSGQKDVTGSVGLPNGPTASETPNAMDRWVVRDVRRGAALLEGRMGLIEVVRGDVVPGLGRVAAIGKQDGRWIVITTRGLITSTR